MSRLYTWERTVCVFHCSCAKSFVPAEPAQRKETQTWVLVSNIVYLTISLTIRLSDRQSPAPDHLHIMLERASSCNAAAQSSKCSEGVFVYRFRDTMRRNTASSPRRESHLWIGVCQEWTQRPLVCSVTDSKGRRSAKFSGFPVRGQLGDSSGAVRGR
eukprot:gene11348-biopygen13922